MGKIVALGGSSTGRGATRRIDEEIVGLTGKRRPRALYIPTASKDNLDSWRRFRRAFGRLGCECDVLLTIGQCPSRRQVRRQIAWADLVFVGGGNTLLLMRRWKFLGVDRELLRAYRRGTVLAGGSAGSICWFEQGHSDSMRGYGHDPWEYIAVSGLGLLKGIHCPHYHHKDRRAKFMEMLARRGGWGLGIDDFAALEVVDGKWRIIASKTSANAYAVFRRRDRVLEQLVPRQEGFQPLAKLYEIMRGAQPVVVRPD